MLLFSSETSIQKTETISSDNYCELLKKGFRVEKHLSGSKKAGLAFEEFTRLIFLPATIVVIILLPELWPLFIVLLGIKLIAHLLIIKITQNHLNQHKIFISSLVYDLFVPYFKFFYRWSFNRKSRKNKWRNKN